MALCCQMLILKLKCCFHALCTNIWLIWFLWWVKKSFCDWLQLVGVLGTCSTCLCFCCLLILYIQWWNAFFVDLFFVCFRIHCICLLVNALACQCLCDIVFSMVEKSVFLNDCNLCLCPEFLRLIWMLSFGWFLLLIWLLIAYDCMFSSRLEFWWVLLTVDYAWITNVF